MIELGGLALVLISALLMLALAVYGKRKENRLSLRQIDPLQRLQRAIAHVVESGERLHISLGNGSIIEPTNASTLVGLSTLQRIARLSVNSDHLPYATSGESTIALLSKNMLQAGYREGEALDLYNPDHARLSGITPFSYIGGLISHIHDDEITSHLLLGHFGSEIALAIEAANRENRYILGASDSLPAQSVMFAMSPHVLIGEELFATPTYLQGGILHQASLHTQDILRWMLIVVMLGGTILQIMGII